MTRAVTPFWSHHGAVVTLAAALLVALPVAAQQPAAAGEKTSSVSKVERLNRAPVSKEVLRVKLPKPFETTLPNGLRVLILEDHRFPLVTVNLLILGAGATAEPADVPGLASTTAAMLHEGTTTRSSKQIAEETEKLGAEIAFYAPFGGTAASMTASGLSDNFNDWFALALDELLHPSFPSDELAKWKQRAAVRLRQQRSSPQFLMRERYSLAVYCANPDEPSSCLPEARVSETPASVEAMTAERLAAWHDARFVPQNAILAVAGDVETKSLVAKLTSDLAAWKRTDLADQPPPPTRAVSDRHIYLVDRPNSVQTTLWLGNIAIDRRDPDYIPVVVANRIFGGGPAARLFLNLREEKGYTYGVYSYFNAVRYAGPWAASGDVTRDVTEGALHEFLYEFTRLGKDSVSDQELDDARRAVVASFALSLEQPDRLINYAVDAAIYSLPSDYWDSYPAKISAVTAPDVTRVAAKYLDPAKLQIVGVGDAKKVLPAFENYGAVKLYDTQGKPEPPAATGGTNAPSSGAPANGSQSEAPRRIRVSAGVAERNLVKRVEPDFPPYTGRGSVQGKVRLRVVISTDGTVKLAEPVSGDPALFSACIAAVRQWIYKPTLIDEPKTGRVPIEVESVVDINYKFGEGR
jgi:predicted Zn-dependent peptidase